MCQWDEEGEEVVEDTPACPTVIWFHDESIFYAYDCCKLHWVHSSETTKPYAKGEGQSYMIADFISADHGWLCSVDGMESAHIELKPGKNRDGYFSNDEVLEQAEAAIHLACKLYPHQEMLGTN